MSESVFYPRYVGPRLAEMLEDSQAVLIHGPRQCGNTTLAQFVYASDYLKFGDDSILCGKDRFTSGTPRQNLRDYTYISFDDAIERKGTQDDPILSAALEL